MSDVLRFALLGLGIGALYAICAQGLVLIYRASGVVNFAQGAFVMVGGYVYYELHEAHHQPTWIAVAGAAAVGALLGFAVHHFVMRPMRYSSPLTRVVATLGVLVVLQSAAVLRYAHDVKSVKTFLPSSTVDVFGAHITSDRLFLFAIGAIVTVVLWAVYRFTAFGRVTTAVAENEQAAASMGHSPDGVAGINWMIGATLAAVTGVLIAPITYLEPNQLSELVLPALAAALLGGFASFPLAFLAAMVIGVGESVMTLEVTEHNWWAGWASSIPFLVVVAYLVIRGRSIPLRSHIFDRLPSVGSGRIRATLVIVLLVGSCAAMAVLANEWAVAATVTVAFAALCLSVVLVTGYGGQLSLAQYVIGGVGAFVAAKLMASHGVRFEVAFVCGILAAIIIGAAVGAPALRTRGINLAIATLGLAVALYALFLSNSQLTGSIQGIEVLPPSLFGWDINPDTHPQRYGCVAVVVLGLIALAVANLRRGAAGRRLLAVRSNERSALALGVNVFAAKLYAFMLAAGVAGVGASLLAFLNTRVLFSRFDVFSSINLVTATVVGGVGYIGGAIIGSTLIPGGITSRFLSDLSSGLERWLPLIGGVFVLLTLRSAPDGAFEMNRHLVAKLAQKLGKRPVPTAPPPEAVTMAGEGIRSAPLAPVVVQPRTLTVRGVTVRFGGVIAVNDMSLTVRPATVHGLIGPNGAGKTTFIDAVTGFVTPSAGTIALDDIDLTGTSARRRAQAGIARSFQSGELFADMTVRENLAVGGDDRSWWRYLADLVHPGRIHLSAAAELAAREFELEDCYDITPASLPFGKRRLVAIARAVASAPPVLLLDEPASGLDDHEAEELAKLIRSLARDWGIAILLVEHNLDLVLSLCDEITVMDGGLELVAASSPAVVRSHPEVLEAYIGAHHERPPSADSEREGAVL